MDIRDGYLVDPYNVDVRGQERNRGQSVLERPPLSGLAISQRTGAWQQGSSTKVEVQKP